MTTAERIKRTLARQIIHHAEECDRARDTKPFTPGDYASVARRLAESLAKLEECDNLWTAFGFGSVDRLSVERAANG